MIEKPVADEKVEQGWLRIWLVFELLAVSEAKANEAMQEHIKKLDNDSRIKVYKKQLSDIKKIEKPLKGVKEGFSLTADIELVVQNFDNIVQIVLEYGPSSIEVLDPKNIKMGMGEAQGVLNSISQMMHRFAAAGLGGIVVLGKQE